MRRQPPISPRTVTRWPYTTRFRSCLPDDEATRRAAMRRKVRLQAQSAGALDAALITAACNPSATDDAATAPATADRQALWANALRDGSLAGLPPLPDAQPMTLAAAAPIATAP